MMTVPKENGLDHRDPHRGLWRSDDTWSLGPNPSTVSPY